MESRDCKDNLRKLILDMAQKELEEHASTKGAQKYFEGNVDKVINNNIQKIGKERSSNSIYTKVIKQGTYQENVVSVAKVIKKEEIFKSKNELLKFARYLGLNLNMKQSYGQILKKVSRHIYSNRNLYSKKYVLYRRGNQEYILEPEKIKNELFESYRSKTRDDMKSIARLLDLNVKDDEGAEDIRKKVINYIIKEKLGKKGDKKS
ncbi:hypothetical protein [Romboutsia sp. Marseille-P6047]|uniref:hypothetical protein n=1 Tax=Romboutsia sp. Marseille-P6047 TaxID=2161817 RepID=UPI000F04C51B|nr:hypothetical protein [Romboutsia sp. Marseille-P6047]